jgi:hypothetical protein
MNMLDQLPGAAHIGVFQADGFRGTERGHKPIQVFAIPE